MEQILADGLAELGIPCPAQAPQQLARYGELLLEKNQVMNLTAIRDPEGVARLHMLDCAALLRWVDFRQKTLIDVGTGAGFPGLVLKILVPTLQVTLLDSLNKSTYSSVWTGSRRSAPRWAWRACRRSMPVRRSRPCRRAGGTALISRQPAPSRNCGY